MTEGFPGRVGFVIGTGRCGTKFFVEALRDERRVHAVHERNRDNEAFHRYCKWYGIDVDHEGFLTTKEKEIAADLERHDFSLESSAHLSFSVPELHARFGARFLLLVRAPHRVVSSYLAKGWYAHPIARGDADLPPSWQQNSHPHHFLARIMPSGSEFERWQGLSRAGKLGWFWSALNRRVLDDFGRLPEADVRVQRLEDLEHATFVAVCETLGFRTGLSPAAFVRLRKQRPNRLNPPKSVAGWTDAERREFEVEVAPLARELGYEYRTDRLAEEPESPE